MVGETRERRTICAAYAAPTSRVAVAGIGRVTGSKHVERTGNMLDFARKRRLQRIR